MTRGRYGLMRRGTKKGCGSRLRHRRLGAATIPHVGRPRDKLFQALFGTGRSICHRVRGFDNRNSLVKCVRCRQVPASRPGSEMWLRDYAPQPHSDFLVTSSCPSFCPGFVACEGTPGVSGLTVICRRSHESASACKVLALRSQTATPLASSHG